MSYKHNWLRNKTFVNYEHPSSVEKKSSCALVHVMFKWSLESSLIFKVLRFFSFKTLNYMERSPALKYWDPSFSKALNYMYIFRGYPGKRNSAFANVRFAGNHLVVVNFFIFCKLNLDSTSYLYFWEQSFMQSNLFPF